MRVPTPRELGLPEKFDRWRPAQVEAFAWLMTRQRRVKALCAPTGFGKSPLYVGYAIWTRQPTCFVTNSRALQDQLMGDFGSIGMVDIRGRNNYTCGMRPGWSCEQGYAARCPKKGSIHCPSSQAEMRAAISPLVVTNYDKWTTARKFGIGMSHFQQVVFDEGHESPAALARAMQVSLGHREVGGMGVDFPSSTQAEEFVNWRPWAVEARGEAERALALAQEAMRAPHPRPAVVRDFIHLRNLVRRLGIIATANPAQWVVDEVKDGYQFDPVRVGRYSEAALLLHVPSVLIVSATLRPKTLYLIGIGKDTMDFKECASEFDPARCPIYYVPTMRVDSRVGDLSLLWMRLDQIAARRTDRKGIVHTISYARRDEILSRSRYASAMMVNEKGEAATWMVKAFKAAPAGTILVSPSVGAGFDFPGRDCEFQFVCKIPFPDSRSKIQRARQEDDPEYGAYHAMNKLIQIFGRGMRSKEDHCENFISDDHLQWFLPRYSYLAPKWFKGFYRRVDILPQPPPRL